MDNLMKKLEYKKTPLKDGTFRGVFRMYSSIILAYKLKDNNQNSMFDSHNSGCNN